MRFYYFSLFSWMLYVTYLILSLGILWGAWTKLFKGKLANPVYWSLVGAIVVGPWIEELRIAFDFDRLCRKDAGIFVSRSIHVDGFYDDTTHWWRQLAESQYKFVESRDYIDDSLWRVERVGGEIRHFKIDRPTAPYRYRRTHNHTEAAHKISEIEYVVDDARSGEVLGRYTNYYRAPYWFFISLDAPSMPCSETEADVRKHGTLSVYALTLKPSK